MKVELVVVVVMVVGMVAVEVVVVVVLVVEVVVDVEVLEEMVVVVEEVVVVVVVVKDEEEEDVVVVVVQVMELAKEVEVVSFFKMNYGILGIKKYIKGSSLLILKVALKSKPEPAFKCCCQKATAFKIIEVIGYQLGIDHPQRLINLNQGINLKIFKAIISALCTFSQKLHVQISRL
ncbi:hypothetical protein GBA52_010453 [Prunus armeniaca]|nr:hypothetical protein GBA52_010453 [Prunus armeniaca]